MQSSRINYDVFANAAKFSAEFGGNVLDKAVQGIGAIRAADVQAGVQVLKDKMANNHIAGYADMFEHISMVKTRNPDTDDSTPVAPAVLGVTDKLLGVFYRHAVTAAMGSFPTHSVMQIAHLNAAICEDLIFNTRVYQSVCRGGDAFVWDTRKTRSGDIIGRMHTEAFSKTGCTAGEIDTGVSISFSGIGGISLGERTMIVVGSNALGADTISGVELALGGLRLRMQNGYSHFGISVPSRYLDKVIIHTRGRNAVYCHFQTGLVNKSLGSLADHRDVKQDIGSIRFSNVIPNDIDYLRVPQFMPLYKVRWTGNTQTVLSFNKAQFLNVGPLTVLLDHPIDFNMLTPSRRSGTVSYFALLAFSEVGDSVETYRQLADVINAGRHPKSLRVPADADTGTETHVIGELEFYSKQNLVTEDHHLGSVGVHTYEGSVVTTYRAMPAGHFDVASIPNASDLALNEVCDILGRSKL